MVDNIFTRVQSLASRQIGKLGQLINFKRAVAGTIDPVTGLGTAGTAITFAGTGLIFDYEKKLIDGVQIQTQDKRLLLEPDLIGGNEPMIDDVVTTIGGDFTVISVSPLAPDGMVIKYDVQLRS
ncbi:MAG: hypothetical protein RQ783_08525 [Gammaproteobacteria bacterium]|nr:hypothetical protein [Gammaproteobacteria bacterium]